VRPVATKQNDGRDGDEREDKREHWAGGGEKNNIFLFD
jgi:hypothetical protein